MRKAHAFFVTALSFATLCTFASAQQLPKSGSIEFHTGFKLEAQPASVAEKNAVGQGSAIGVTYADKGSGPLHGGPATCFFSFFVADGLGRSKGYCAFGDADGDRIFTDWHGKDVPPGSEGVNEIVGGTGKYAGIQGRGPWKCRPVGANGESACNQRLDYRLP